MTTITHLSCQHANALSKLQANAFQQAYSDVHSSENIRSYCTTHFSTSQATETLNSPNYLIKAAVDAGVMGGYYILHFVPCPINVPGRSAELKQIYILAKHYATGMGKRLFDDAITNLRRKEYDYVWLAVSDINVRAQAFYFKRGFAAIGSGPVFNVGTDRLTSSVLAAPL